MFSYPKTKEGSMHRVAIGLAILLKVAKLTRFVLSPCPAPLVTAQVLRVVDGDTVAVKILSVPSQLKTALLGGNKVTIRPIGVDTLEHNALEYEEAKQINDLLVEGKKVYLELDQPPFDPNGRLLAYVYLDKDGHFMVNLALVTSTLFRAYTFENTPRYNTCFTQADVSIPDCSACGTPPTPRVCVPAEQANRYYGKEIWVCGVVASVSRLAYGRIFLNFGRPYPNQVFTVMIDEKYTSAFDSRLGPRWENKLQGRWVCVYGLVKEYQGKPEILPTDPGQIRAEVLGVPCPDFCPCK